MARSIFLTSYVMPRTQRWRAWVVFSIVIGLLLLVEFVGLASPLRTLSEGWWRFWTVRINQGLAVIVQPLVDLQTLSANQQRLRELEVKYAQSLAQVTELDQLRQENQSLRSLVSSRSTTQNKGIITAPIIAYGRPLIAVGTQEGIQPGMMAIVADTLIGVVTDVQATQSKVTLLNQEDTPHILARTEAGITGIVRGNGQRVIMTEVPSEQVVLVGQRVVTQGQDGIAPNILIGTVAEVRANATSAVQTVIIEQIVSFYETSVLEVR